MGKHIFDILGVGTREDSYTDLIAYAFEHDAGFRRSFLALLAEKKRAKDSTEKDEQGEFAQTGGWQCKTRATIRAEGGRSRAIPDVVLWSPRAHQVIVIENKLLSGEGSGQTRLYESADYTEALSKANALGEESLNSWQLLFFFLTLEGNQPESDRFIPVSYADVAELVPAADASEPKLAALLAEFRERVMGYKEYPPPRDDEEVIRYLEGERKQGVVTAQDALVTQRRRFELLVRQLPLDQVDEGFHLARRPSVTRGYIPLAEVHKRAWYGEEYSKESPPRGDQCFDVHFELQWDTLRQTVALLLHYHTVPYMTKAEFNELPERFRTAYANKRRRFYERLRQEDERLKRVHWSLHRYSLRLACSIIRPQNEQHKMTVADFKEVVQKRMPKMASAVDEALAAAD